MRFNPPPNWPPPPPGWTPPPGWEPDPAWGPPPYGWPLWVDDAEPVSRGGPSVPAAEASTPAAGASAPVTPAWVAPVPGAPSLPDPGPSPVTGPDPAPIPVPIPAAVSEPVPAAISEPAAAGPAAQPGRRRWLRVLVAASLAVVLAAGAVAGGIVFLDRRAREQQRQDYASGHAAYLKADCDRAVRLFERALGRDKATRVAGSARRERTSCQEYLASLEEARGQEPAQALLVHLDYLDGRVDEPLRVAALERVRTMAADTSAKDLADGLVCARMDDVEAALDAEAKPPAWLPPFLLACASSWEGQEDDDKAMALYERVRKDFAKTKHADRATAGLVRLNYRVARREGARRFSGPVLVGTDPSLDGRVRIRLRNATPDAMSLMMTGPESLIRSIKKCPTCTAYSSPYAAKCPFTAPTLTVTIKPGRYQAVLGDLGGLPSVGTWSFKANGVYEECVVLIGKRPNHET